MRLSPSGKSVFGHAEGQNVFSKVVVESTGTTPKWSIRLLEHEGFILEVFSE